MPRSFSLVAALLSLALATGLAIRPNEPVKDASPEVDPVAVRQVDEMAVFDSPLQGRSPTQLLW